MSFGPSSDSPPDSPPILLDGATGTELERRGARMTAPLWSAHALLEAPEVVTQIHGDYLAAGAQVITTNTFRTHARNLAAAGLQARARELTGLAVALACAARERSSRGQHARVAGAISPLEDCFRTEDSPGAAAYAEHREIAAHLVEAGCDILLAETFGRVDEARAAVRAAQGLGRPVWLAVVARADGRLLAGESFDELLAGLAGLELQALLVNCTDLKHLEAAAAALVRAAEVRPELWLGASPHTGHAHPELGWQTHATGVEAFVRRLAEVAAAHPRLALVGSCCGSTPAWTEALARRLHPTPEVRAAADARLTAAAPRAQRA